MPKKRRKLDVFCQNPECKCCNKKGLKNIVRNGKRQNGTQYYRCTECGVSFVRTKGTIFYYKKLKKDDVVEISRHIVETMKIAIRNLCASAQSKKAIFKCSKTRPAL